MKRYSRTVCLIAFTLTAVGVATSYGAGAGDTPAPAGKPLEVVFFFSPTCHECQKVKQVLPAILQRWGSRLAVQMRNIEDMQLFSQLLEYEKYYKVQVAAPPAIFVGGQALLGESQIIARLDAAIAEETARGSATFMPGAPPQGLAAGADNMPAEILTRFEGFSAGAVAVAGLIDGINPCAFTTIVFFLSMLAYLKKTRSQMLAVGIGFTAGMFAAYFLLGLGMLVAVKSLAVSHGLSTALTWGVAAFAFGLAIWSLVDAVLYHDSATFAQDVSVCSPIVLLEQGCSGRIMDDWSTDCVVVGGVAEVFGGVPAVLSAPEDVWVSSEVSLGACGRREA